MTRRMKKREYNRVRMDTGQHRRITVTAVTLGILAFIPVIAQLGTLMIRDYGYYSHLALRNQTEV